MICEEIAKLTSGPVQEMQSNNIITIKLLDSFER